MIGTLTQLIHSNVHSGQTFQRVYHLVRGWEPPLYPSEQNMTPVQSSPLQIKCPNLFPAAYQEREPSEQEANEFTSSQLDNLSFFVTRGKSIMIHSSNTPSYRTHSLSGMTSADGTVRAMDRALVQVRIVAVLDWLARLWWVFFSLSNYGGLVSLVNLWPHLSANHRRPQ